MAGQHELQETVLSLYQEALIHPALISHPNPERVAMISGSAQGGCKGGGGISSSNLLKKQQVLQHNTVQDCVEFCVEESCASNADDSKATQCRIIQNSGLSEFDHSCSHHGLNNTASLELQKKQQVGSLVDAFGTDMDEKDKFDVIIVDDLSPLEVANLVGGGNNNFLPSLLKYLTDDGVLVAHTGVAITQADGDAVWNDEVLSSFAHQLQDNGAISLKSYVEHDPMGQFSWRFHIAFMSNTSKSRFYLEAAQVDLELAKRLAPSEEDEDESDEDDELDAENGDSESDPSSFLTHFDGATMSTYQYPSRIVENQFCSQQQQRSSNLCNRPHGFDPDNENVPSWKLETRTSSIPNAGRGVFFMQAFSKGSFLAIDDSVHNMLVMPPTMYLLYDLLDRYSVASIWSVLVHYLEGYAIDRDVFGGEASIVDAGLATFANHGCNGSYVMGRQTGVTELTADPHQMPDYGEVKSLDHFFYDPVAERNLLLFDQSCLLSDVSAGQEVLDNYLGLYTNVTWQQGVEDLKKQCLKQGVGVVTEYEKGGH